MCIFVTVMNRRILKITNRLYNLNSNFLVTCLQPKKYQPIRKPKNISADILYYIFIYIIRLIHFIFEFLNVKTSFLIIDNIIQTI